MLKNRLPVQKINPFARVNADEIVHFRFDGKDYQGYAGDSLASALLANDVFLQGRSFKYHRPRGLISAGIEEANALVQLENGSQTQPNLPATMINLYEGLEANSQNRYPSLSFDIGAINMFFARLFPAGFYYKTFMWPANFWEPIYEKMIRKAAGLGVAPNGKDASRYAQRFFHSDILIVGGGIAGLYAGLIAARAGAKILLVDENPYFGGHAVDDPELGSLAGKNLCAIIDEWLAELKEMTHVTLLLNSTVSGLYDDNYITILERVQDHIGYIKENKDISRHRLWKIRAKQVITATGALERPLIFANNDRPGIMLAGAVKSYINRYGVLPGKHIVIFCNNDTAYRTAIIARQAGAHVLLVDNRPIIGHDLHQSMLDLEIEVRLGAMVIDTKGRHRISMVKIATHLNGALTSEGEWLSADLLGMSGGLNPIVHLYSQARGKLDWDDGQALFKPNGKLTEVMAIGAANGIFDLDGLIKDAGQCVKNTLKALGLKAPARLANLKAVGGNILNIAPLWEVPHKKGQKAFHEFQNDSTAADIHLAAREGFISVEHLKRYTTTGMATDQGKTSNINALAIMASIRGLSVPEVGTTTFRPPYSPISFGAITGQNRRHLFQQARTTPMHKDHVASNAIFEDVGDWKRPYYFPRSGESMQDAVRRECQQTRNTVGMVDASTLGKIDIQGKDAAWFLDMIYTNMWSSLGVGRARYGLMCNEHGMVFDDGVTTRIGENHFHMTTTTGGAARVMNWLEEWLQTEWPEREVYCTSVTEQWAVASINGPQSRNMLQALSDIDLSQENFPFMHFKTGKIAGIDARIFRISFTGELGFEVNVPARYGLSLWQALKEAGKPYDLCIYGTESLHVLRAEKGFIIVGQDTDGTVTPQDLGMNWIISKKKEDFIGKRSHSRSDTAKSGRKQLVGLLSDDPNLVLKEGAHIVKDYQEKPDYGEAQTTLGHVTSSYYSSNLGRSIAMGMVYDGLNRMGEIVTLPDMKDNKPHKAVICKPIFFDAEGTKNDG